jgi:hypothetical protein
VVGMLGHLVQTATLTEPWVGDEAGVVVAAEVVALGLKGCPMASVVAPVAAGVEKDHRSYHHRRAHHHRCAVDNRRLTSWNRYGWTRAPLHRERRGTVRPPAPAGDADQSWRG